MDRELIEILANKVGDNGTVLDIGFGTGRIAFEVLAFTRPSKIVGLEIQTRFQIEGDPALFSVVDDGLDKGVYQLVHDGKIDLFDYYSYYTKNLGQLPVDRETFTNKIEFNFSTDVDKFILADKSKFDLVILFNVLHYKDIGDPLEILKKVKGVLTDNALLLIGFKAFDNFEQHSDRQDVNMDEMLNALQADFEKLILRKHGSSTIYLGQRYAPQQRA